MMIILPNCEIIGSNREASESSPSIEITVYSIDLKLDLCVNIAYKRLMRKMHD